MIRHISALAALVALSLSSVACVAPTDEGTQAEETSEDLVLRSASFETFQGLDSRYYFHLVAANGQKVLRSEGYEDLSGAERGVSAVLASGNDKRNFDILEASDGSFYFNLRAPNGQVVGTSGLYSTKSNAERGASTVRAL